MRRYSDLIKYVCVNELILRCVREIDKREWQPLRQIVDDDDILPTIGR